MRLDKSSERNTSASPIKSLKEAFKFHKLTSKKVDRTSTPKLLSNHTGEASQASPSRHKSSKRDKMRSHNTNRESAQRITLFKHDNVKMLHGNLMSTPSSLSDFQQCATSLLAMGRMEIYEIKTNSSCSKYLTIGKDSNIVHPLLPRLRVSKAGLQNQYYISFSNPDRFWEIQFAGDDRKSMEEFEQVISRLCDFVILPETQNESDHDESRTMDTDDVDELNYLLSDVEQEELFQNDTVSVAETSHDNTSIRSNVCDSNSEFRKVMQGILPPLDENLTSSKWSLPSAPTPLFDFKKNVSKRQSLYIGSSEVSVDISSLKYNRRSISGLSDYDTLVSLQNLHLDD